VAFYPRSVPVIDLSCDSHTWSRSVRYRTLVHFPRVHSSRATWPAPMPVPSIRIGRDMGLRRQAVGQVGKPQGLARFGCRGALGNLYSRSQASETAPYSQIALPRPLTVCGAHTTRRRTGESRTSVGRPNPLVLVPSLRGLTARAGMLLTTARRAPGPYPFRSETVGAVRALRRYAGSFSLGNAQPGTLRSHSAEPSAIRVQRRSARRRAACVSPITVHASRSSSFSFAAMTAQPPSTVRRAAKIITSSFNRPQDGRRSLECPPMIHGDRSNACRRST
jgi:hypothetical protein